MMNVLAKQHKNVFLSLQSCVVRAVRQCYQLQEQVIKHDVVKCPYSWFAIHYFLQLDYSFEVFVFLLVKFCSVQCHQTGVTLMTAAFP